MVPVFGCADCLGALYRRLLHVLEGREFELVMVDDASRDGAWPILKEVATADRRVTAVRLARNVGQQAAIKAGLSASRGERAVVMDCDLEDPPEWIPELLARADRGFDIVLTRYGARSRSWWRSFASRLYFYLVRRRTGNALLERPGMFSVLSRSAIDAYLASPEAGRLYLQALVGLPLAMDVVDYPRQPRYAGRSAYTVGRLVKLFVNGVTRSPDRRGGDFCLVREMIQDGVVR